MLAGPKLSTPGTLRTDAFENDGATNTTDTVLEIVSALVPLLLPEAALQASADTSNGIGGWLAHAQYAFQPHG